MGVGYHEKQDEENPQSEDENEAEKKRLNQPEEGIELKTITSRDKDGSPQIILGTVKPMFKTHYLKYAMFTFNGILAVLGLVVLVLAVWIRVDPEFFEYQNSLSIQSFYAVSVMFIVAGLIIFFVAFLGCVGAFAEHQMVLTVYFIVYTVLFILQLAAVIMIFSAPYNKTLRGAMESQIKKQVDKRNTAESSRLFIDLMQQNLECCGSLNEHEYEGRIPNSCYSQVDGTVNAHGCSDMMLKYLRSKAGIIGGVGVPLLVFQGLALIITFCLLYNIKNQSKYEMKY